MVEQRVEWGIALTEAGRCARLWCGDPGDHGAGRVGGRRGREGRRLLWEGVLSVVCRRMPIASGASPAPGLASAQV